ncbi:MAG TPA: DUF1707 domain-containing protein [Solirubrobacter sp.]|nr:DUF1707 domain-containing protein [Solirubrobacter sp.]
MTYSELRASDAERERVVAFLREHALLGRLDDEELEERIGQAYAAVTVGDLERLIADLPRRGRAPAPRPAPPRPVRRGPHPGVIVAGVCALLLVGVPAVGVVLALGVALIATVFALSFVLGPILLVALLIVATARRRRAHHRPMRWGPQY